MKTIEVNTTTAIVFALFIAGIGSLLPSFFNLAGYLSSLVYVISSIAIAKAYKNKMYYKINNKE